MKNLFELLEDFILVYLPKERGYSKNTSISYYTAIKQYITYLINEKRMIQSDISLFNFDRNGISSFLSHIENNGRSIETRNQKRAALISFMKYCSMIEPIYQKTLDDVSQIKSKKTEINKSDFLTIEEYKALINAVDLNTKGGLRHYVIINLLYDTASRVSELINIKVEDLNYGSQNSIKIYGKGKKYRIVYITKHTVKLIEDYLKLSKISDGYIFVNNQGKPLTRFGVEYIVNRYYTIACEQMSSLKYKRVTPHTLRHTKACHFLINGTSIPVIQKFLGHSSIKTTEIYLDLTSDMIIDAVEKASSLIVDTSTNITNTNWKDDTILNQINEIFRKSN